MHQLDFNKEIFISRMQGANIKIKMSYIFKIVSVLTFLKIVLLIVPINCKNFANLNSTSPVPVAARSKA